MNYKLQFIVLFILFQSINVYGNQLITITPEQFIAENPSDERKEIVNFIVHQFDNKRETGVTQAQLDKVWNNLEARSKFCISRFQIIDQKLYAGSGCAAQTYFMSLVSYFERLLQVYKIKDVDFIIYVRDEIPYLDGLADKLLEVPGFIGSKDGGSTYEKDLFLLPDAFMLRSGWSHLVNQITTANKDYEWKDKIDKVFWRGGTTGRSKGAYQLDNFDKLPRLTLVMLSKLYPDLIDAQFTYYMKSAFNRQGKPLRKILDILLGEDLKKVKEVEHLKYKYLIAIDGNTSPWVRVPWIMASNSVLVKQETGIIQWFYPALKPYVHYIPVSENLTNIFEQIKWMKSNDNEVKLISLNAQNFIKNNMMPDDIDVHMVIILNEYSSIQKDNKIIANLPKSENSIPMWPLLETLFHKLFEKVIWWFNTWF